MVSGLSITGPPLHHPRPHNKHFLAVEGGGWRSTGREVAGVGLELVAKLEIVVKLDLEVKLEVEVKLKLEVKLEVPYAGRSSGIKVLLIGQYYCILILL